MSEKQAKIIDMENMTKKNKELPSIECIRECLTYDKESGDLTWKKRPLEHFSSPKRMEHWNYRFSGKLAGHAVPLGYRRIKLFGSHVLAHRIIWLLEKGEWPQSHLDIDHIDRNPANNKIENLRLASRSQNIINSKIRRSNKSGVKNVFFNKKDGKWWARVNINKSQKLLGRFDSKEEAASVANLAMKIEYGEFYIDQNEQL